MVDSASPRIDEPDPTRSRASGEPVTGARVVGRVTRLLRVVSVHSPAGAATSTLASEAGLTRPTAHRLLTSLAAEGFVDRDPDTGVWALGPELYLMGSIAAARYDISEIAAPSVHALARETGESAFLSARRGSETVCLMRVDGSFPLRSFVLAEGVRFPLGVASAGMALIAFLDDGEIDDYLDHHDLVATHGPTHSDAEVRAQIAATRSRGVALNEGRILQGSWGMAAAIFDPAGRPAWALSITGVEARFAADRQPELTRLLLMHAHHVTQRLRGVRPGN
jgi:DNA-binding IclR family transcriptional regulator